VQPREPSDQNRGSDPAESWLSFPQPGNVGNPQPHGAAICRPHTRNLLWFYLTLLR
jgi:hypothetical protein